VRTDVGIRDRFPSGEVGWIGGGHGGVDEGVPVIGVGEVDRGSATRGRQIAPRDRLRTALHPRCPLLLAEGESEPCR
jgi:hypothetical protein